MKPETGKIATKTIALGGRVNWWLDNWGLASAKTNRCSQDLQTRDIKICSQAIEHKLNKNKQLKPQTMRPKRRPLLGQTSVVVLIATLVSINQITASCSCDTLGAQMDPHHHPNYASSSQDFVDNSISRQAIETTRTRQNSGKLAS